MRRQQQNATIGVRGMDDFEVYKGNATEPMEIPMGIYTRQMSHADSAFGQTQQQQAKLFVENFLLAFMLSPNSLLIYTTAAISSNKSS